MKLSTEVWIVIILLSLVFGIVLGYFLALQVIEAKPCGCELQIVDNITYCMGSQ